MLKIETRLEKFVSLGTFWEESEPMLERIGSRCDLEHGCTQVWDRLKRASFSHTLSHSLTLSHALCHTHPVAHSLNLNAQCKAFAHIKFKNYEAIEY